MRDFYTSAAYNPKAARPADNVLAAIKFALRQLPPPLSDEVEQVANDFAVKVTEHAMMQLEADEENTEQIEAFGALVEQEFRTAIAAMSQASPPPSDEVERLLDSKIAERESEFNSLTMYDNDAKGWLAAWLDDLREIRAALTACRMGGTTDE